MKKRKHKMKYWLGLLLFFFPCADPSSSAHSSSSELPPFFPPPGTAPLLTLQHFLRAPLAAANTSCYVIQARREEVRIPAHWGLEQEDVWKLWRQGPEGQRKL